MKRTLLIVYLLFSGLVAFAQKSYLIAAPNPNDTAFLKAQCRKAGIDLGLTVLANRIPTDSQLVTPKPSEHLLKQGILKLQLPMDEKQDEFAVYRSDLFNQPAYINVLQIDEELITYRTTERSGDIQLIYGCTRGAFGTKKSAHSKDATVYKLWDTPERTLLPDLEQQNLMAQAEAQRLAKTNYPLLIFNDLKSYGYIEGDAAIGSLLDTMRKYNPDKLIQGDLLSPVSQCYLDRINENQLWNATMRTKIVETLAVKQEFYHSHQMPWMIGNFQVHLADKNQPATTMEELEWFLSQAAAFDAGFGLDFSAETMRHHGLTEAMLNQVNLWETIRLSGAFNEEVKNQLKDPFGNWHLEKIDDSTWHLYPLHISRQYRCSSCEERWEWYSPFKSRFAMRISVEGKGSVSELSFRTANGILYFPCSLEAGQHLLYGFDGKVYLTDGNYNILEEMVPQGVSYLDEGTSEVSFTYEAQSESKKQPQVTVRYFTQGKNLIE